MPEERESRMFASFRGWRGLLLLTVIVGVAALIVDFAFAAWIFGLKWAKENLLQGRVFVGVVIVSFAMALIFWLRFWRARARIHIRNQR
jgi:hypothetical protein